MVDAANELSGDYGFERRALLPAGRIDIANMNASPLRPCWGYDRQQHRYAGDRISPQRIHRNAPVLLCWPPFDGR